VRVAFALDSHDREVISWVATTAGISGEMIRDMRQEDMRQEDMRQEDMRQENHASPKRGIKNEIVRFCAPSRQNPAISKPPLSQKLTHAQWLRNCSRMTNAPRETEHFRWEYERR
jgi:hypothetical protein